ncbi:chemotaxis protein CheC [Hahella aquimaris]|uniref:chemotaxis protein CheC n=1 Tax=Hahella sp. HNIBRBA332 TaxID=3015983 RepID=UPI00273B3883|nr:chemotaxis protein CheC [Hahella sp. HNIBRBA332]WLQ12540.1 chemotaxis protein CheC [Hahella sp. HNIBRBA332]
MFTQDQLDALQEIFNIAMGQGANRLARLIETFVVLSAPKLYSLKSQSDPELIKRLGDTPIIATRQSFVGPLRGEVVIFYGMNGANELAELMGYSQGGDTQRIKEELILDVTNILVGACITGLSQQLNFSKSSFSTPGLLVEGKTVAEALENQRLPQDSEALLVEIQFKIEAHAFFCELLICIANESIATVVTAVDKLLKGV